MKKNIIAVVVFSLLVVSCDSRKKQEKDADRRLEYIRQLISENALNAAKIELDSIHELYPRLIDKRKMASALEDTIARRESMRTLAFCDSILPLKQNEVDSIKKNFRFEKNEKYQENGSYVYKTQLTENNSNRNYLKSYVDEKADFYLISNYCGNRIEHTSIEVSTGDLFAHTDTLSISHSAYHSFSDGGSQWETLTFKNEADKGVAAFIAQNSSVRLKVTLTGRKKYVYYMSDADKKAVAETYRLWVAMKDVIKLEKEIRKSAYRIERINRRK